MSGHAILGSNTTVNTDCVESSSKPFSIKDVLQLSNVNI
jgi:hypothetical protein